MSTWQEVRATCAEWLAQVQFGQAASERDARARAELAPEARNLDLRHAVYKAQLLNATSAMEHQDDDTARSILDGCEPILRGWEWSYVNSRLLDAPKLQSRGECVTEGGRRLSVAFSPDGKRLVSGHDDGAVRIWQTEAPLSALPW